jgi:ornithine carbamoyltransferase
MKAAVTDIRHFIDLDALDGPTLRHIVDAAAEMKAAGRRTPKKFRPVDIDVSTLLMIFEKPSTRTRISFDLAMRQLGGQTIALNNTDLQLGRGESVADTARVLSRYGDAIMIRANSHDTVVELARHATIPIINGLTDKSHPCQIIADILTFEESRGRIEGRTLAWVGGCPGQLAPDPDVVAWAKRAGADIHLTDDPIDAVKGAACVVTDTWVSMGQTDAARRKQLLGAFAVDDALMKRAAKGAIFMHCLPAYRGHEVAASVIDGPQSVVFDEAENRLHAQKAILSWCLGALV